MSRFYVVCFDVADDKRLRQVSKQLKNFGQRVQYSVFECYLDANDLAELKQRLAGLINPEEDHVRYYGLCGKDKPKILLDGTSWVSRDDDYHLC